MHLHFLNARGRLDPVRSRIEASIAQSIPRITALLAVAKVDIVIQANSHVIPETGMAGFSPAADVLYLTFDPSNQSLYNDFDIELLATLGHELHHCRRHDGPGYGHTLREALVSEGLACHFEATLRDGVMPFYASALNAQALDEALARAQPFLDAPEYDHKAWFFGSSVKGIVRHTGYSLGYRLVDRYVQRSGLSAVDLWATPAKEIFGA